jgi:hypothetical protein
VSGVDRLRRPAFPARQSRIADLWGEVGNDFVESTLLGLERENLPGDHVSLLLRCVKLALRIIVHMPNLDRIRWLRINRPTAKKKAPLAAGLFVWWIRSKANTAPS